MKTEPLKQLKMQNKTAKLITTRGKHSEFMFSKYEGTDTQSRYLKNNTPRGLTKLTGGSRTVIEIMPFKLDPILDNPAGEEKGSPENQGRNTVRYFRNSNVLIASACLSSRDNGVKEKRCSTHRNENLSPRLCFTELGRNKLEKKDKFRTERKHTRASKEENARRHLVRSHLNELYTKISIKVKSQAKERKHHIRILHNHL